MRIEDSIRLKKFKEIRQLQYERRVIIIVVPDWVAKIRRIFMGYGPEAWNYDRPNTPESET